MKRMLIDVSRDELRVAVMLNEKLIDLDMERSGHKMTKANIYKGKISSIEPSLGAVFVDYGSERHGFLPFKEISSEYFLSTPDEGNDTPDLHKLLKVGQELVIQVEKEERGNKGAALTTFISLAGAYLVLMPNSPRGGGISRRIDGEKREKLREIINELNLPEGMSLIIRTAGVSKSKEELEWDLSVLLKYWDAIKQAAIVQKGPYLIHQESDVVIRAIRDNLKQDVSELIVNDPAAYERIKAHLSQVRPDFLDRLVLYSDQLPLFSAYKAEQQIETAHDREVRLPSGGSIVIDHTEALVSIDINSARATRGKSIEETAFNTNLEAAQEIARQLRIRDIGGLIVIDFIDMTPMKHQREVENCLRDKVSKDRARIQFGRISRFGLLEMSRQRIRPSLSNTSQLPCPRCNGKGTIRDVESLALTIIHSIQEDAVRSPLTHFHVQVPVTIASILMNEKRLTITEIEAAYQVKIIIIPNTQLQTPHYNIRIINKTSTEKPSTTPSYKLVQPVKTEQTRKPRRKNASAEPVVDRFLNSNIPAPKRPGSVSRFFKRLFATTPIDTKNSESDSTEKKASEEQRPQGQRRNNSRRNQGNSKRRRPADRADKPAADKPAADKPTSEKEESGNKRQPRQRNQQRRPRQEGERRNDNRPRRNTRPNRQQKPADANLGNGRPASADELQEHRAKHNAPKGNTNKEANGNVIKKSVNKDVDGNTAAVAKAQEALTKVDTFIAPKQASQPRKRSKRIQAPAQDTNS